MKEVQTLAIQSQAVPRCDSEWPPSEAATLIRAALGLVVGMADFERLLSTELKDNQRSTLLQSAARCGKYLLEVFTLLGVDVAVYPKAEKLNKEMASRPTQMLLLRRDIANFSALITSSIYGDEQERACSLRKHPTMRLDLAYTALGIWGQLRRLLKRYRFDMDDVLRQIKGEQHVDGAETTA